MSQRYLNGKIAYQYFYSMGVELTDAERSMLFAAASLAQSMNILTKLVQAHPELTELSALLDTITDANIASTEAHQTVLRIREVMNMHTAGNVNDALARMGIHDEPRKRPKKETKQSEIETQDVRRVNR